MKKLVVALTAVVALSAPALAADMAPRTYAKAAPPVQAAVASWTGFWISGGFGYGLIDIDRSVTSDVAPFTVFDSGHDAGGRGWLGKVGAGADLQFGGNWVAGAFGDVQFSDIKGRTTFACGLGCTGAFEYNGAFKNDYSWAVGARIGYVALPGLLTYFNGGFTQAHFTTTRFDFAGPVSGIYTGLDLPGHSRNGFFLGGGTEYAISQIPGLFWKSEYRLASYGNRDQNQNCVVALGCGTAGFIHSIDHSKAYVQTATTELVYRFNWGGPVVAKMDPRTYAKVAPPVQAIASWTGLWISGGFGYGLIDIDRSVTSAVAPFPVLDSGHHAAGRGWLGKVGAGADYQFGGSWVAGGFADAQFSDIKGRTTFFSAPFDYNGAFKNDYSWAVGARIGYVALPGLLTYFNGGFTEAHFTTTRFNFAGAPGTFGGVELPSHTRNGYFLGGGTEYAISQIPGLFWKSEYRLASYGNRDQSQNCIVAVVGCGAAGTVHSIDHSKAYVQTATTELVYRFNWGGSVVAKY